MLIVKVERGNIEKALKQLKRKVRNTKQIQELRERKQHTKDSEVMRDQMRKAIYIQKKNEDEQGY